MESIFHKALASSPLLVNNHCKIVAIEGLDGAGKTTIANICVEKLIKLGYKARLFSTSSSFNEFWNVVKITIEKDPFIINSDINQILHNLVFLTYLRTKLIELQNNNDILITEWYIYSKMVLSEVYTNQIESKSKRLLECWDKEGMIRMPDYSFFLNITPEEAKKRIIKRNGIFEKKETKAMLFKAYKVWQRYIDNYNIEVIDALIDPDIISDKIIKRITKS